ncbi:hypothetical protein IWQ62_003051 [Dispira parvispora]|uniref:Protein kinase domain-containing protein n=1 Tax=Dispira parvispora TaxID=1520584 RepID=A0A9W8E6W5_9FUNG|nr:hypothetical protein IWQ62_003051 [Dispira parvispora]
MVSTGLPASSAPRPPLITRRASSVHSARSLPAALVLPPNALGAAKVDSQDNKSPCKLRRHSNLPFADTLFSTPNPSAPSSIKDEPSEGLPEPLSGASPMVHLLHNPAERYQVRARLSVNSFLGEGQLAKVYRAQLTHPSNPEGVLQSCVVKLIEGSPGASDTWQAGLWEARILRELQQGIVTGNPHVNRAFQQSQRVVRLYGVAQVYMPKVSSPSATQSVDDHIAFHISGEDTDALLDGSHHEVPDSAECRPYLALVLEDCTYGHLWSWVESHSDAMGLGQWLQWTRQLTEALHQLHAHGYAHNDIKPHNILLTGDLNIRLADFGSAQAVGTLEDTHTSPLDTAKSTASQFAAIGTVAYTAPELLNPAMQPTTTPLGGSSAPASPSPPRPPTLIPAPSILRTPQPRAMASDIYSMGILFFVAGISGRDPYSWTRNAMELMLTAMKGAFWQCEMQRARLTGIPTRTRSLNRAPESFRLARKAIHHVGKTKESNGQSVPTSNLRPTNSSLNLSLVVPPQTSASTPVSPVDATTTRPLDMPLDSIPRASHLFRPPATDPRRHRATTTLGSSPARSLANPTLFFLNGDLVPQSVADLIQAMTAKLPEHRLSTTDILRELEAIESTYLDA